MILSATKYTPERSRTNKTIPDVEKHAPKSKANNTTPNGERPAREVEKQIKQDDSQRYEIHARGVGCGRDPHRRAETPKERIGA